jgi:hypothetical protein
MANEDFLESRSGNLDPAPARAPERAILAEGFLY